MEPVVTFGLIFAAVILLLLAELEHKVTVALLAAVLGVYFGVSYGLFTIRDVFEMLDIDTVLFVVASLVLFRAMGETGLFQFVGLYIVRKLKVGGAGLVYVLLLLSTIFSIFSSNYVSMIVMASITLYLCKFYELGPETLIAVEGVLGNVGGMLLPISSIPGLIVASRKGLSFGDFVTVTAPLIAMLTLLSMAYYRWVLEVPASSEAISIPEEAGTVVEDRSTLYRTLAIFVMFIVGVSFSDALGFTPSFVAFVFLVVMLTFSGLDPSRILTEVNWDVPFFVGGFAVFVGSLEKSGFLDVLKGGFTAMLGIGWPINILVLLFLCAVFSAVLDNVPVVLLLLPIIDGVAASMRQEPHPMYWALILGSNVGGGLSMYGSLPILMALSMAEREGYRVTVEAYTRRIVPLVALHLVISSAYLLLLNTANVV